MWLVEVEAGYMIWTNQNVSFNGDVFEQTARFGMKNRDADSMITGLNRGPRRGERESGNRDRSAGSFGIASFLCSKLGFLLSSKDFLRKPRLETENRQCILCVNILHVFHFMKFTFLAEAWGHSSYIVHNVVYKLLIQFYCKIIYTICCAGSTPSCWS